MKNGPRPDRLQVGIVPRDLATSLVFYRDVLGLPYTGTRPASEKRALHLFSFGSATVKLLEGAATSPTSMRSRSAAGTPAPPSSGWR